MQPGLFLPLDRDPAPAPGPSAGAVVIRFDGADIIGQRGETLVSALLRHAARIGISEFDGTPRAGFCLMGSCQECTVWDADGHRLRACMVELCEGLSVRSTPDAPVGADAPVGPDAPGVSGLPTTSGLSSTSDLPSPSDLPGGRDD
ncbi:(2Fe-2S)-binding protein [Phaeovulum sp. W22_SRMD_FR3]|uniref:(2Fe-2S)-binding protein n=1 Tax=Phaeovulum sp. W22_SRMD_FR3 TaxID=3240274 RepID=UPI003F9A3A62